MAFHVACPITCRRICFCTLGFPRELQSDKAKSEFLEQVARVEDLFKNPWLLKVRDDETTTTTTVQVTVPKVVVPPPPPAVVPSAAATPMAGGEGGLGGDGEELLLLSAQTKRAAMQRKAAVASMAAEDYARRFKSGYLVVKFKTAY